jgi:hypothetical protein
LTPNTPKLQFANADDEFGDVLMAQGNLAEALEIYRHAAIPSSLQRSTPDAPAT